MKKTIFASLLATGMIVAGSSGAFAGNIRDCVIEKANMQLSEGQAAFVAAHGDGKIDALSVAHDNDLNLLDVAKAHAFMWSAGTACALGK